MFYEICKGVKYLHSKNIVHLDLKSSNIFLNENYVPKISDFSWASMEGEKSIRP
jgi:serine/threonine protein kinase